MFLELLLDGGGGETVDLGKVFVVVGTDPNGGDNVEELDAAFEELGVLEYCSLQAGD